MVSRPEQLAELEPKDKYLLLRTLTSPGPQEQVKEGVPWKERRDRKTERLLWRDLMLEWEKV